MKRSAILLALAVLAFAACQAAEAPIEEAVDEAPAAEETAATEETALEAAEPPSAGSGEGDEDSAGTVLFVFGDAFISTGYTMARRGFEEAGYSVVVASPTLEPLAAWGSQRRVVADILLEDAHMEDYDALVFIPDAELAFYAPDPEAYRLAREALEQGKVIGTMRSSQFILANAGLLEGVEIVAHGSYRARLERAYGVIWIPAYVHRDGQIVTAAEPQFASELVAAMLEAMDEGSAGTVLFAFGDGYISTIYMVVRRGFEEAGYTVVVASNTLEPLVAHNSPRRVVADILLEDAHMEDYDALVFPSDDSLAFREPDPEAYRLAREALEQGKVVGAIRAGQFVLARAGLLEGVEMTAHGSYHRRFEEAFGAIWVPAYVHRDGLIVTAAEVPQAALLVEVMLEAMEEQN
jgi:protease I